MSEKLKIAIIGTGSRGVSCFGKIITKRDDIDLVALCDTNPVRLRAAAEILNIKPNFYSSIEEMAANETLDGVIITHYDADHAGSILNLLTCVDADRIYLPDVSDSNGIRQMIQKEYPEKIRLIMNLLLAIWLIMLM